MVEYQGAPCQYCEKPFEENDDIIVCPECGTPYHRACYKEAGHCTNLALHAMGGSWQKIRRSELEEQRRAEKRTEQAEQEAERERGEQPKMLNASLYDGVRLRPDDPTVGLDPAEDFEGEKLGDIAEFVSANRFYYLPLFRLMKETGKKISLNLVCLLFPELQFAYRKMWLHTLLVVLLKTLLSIPYWMTMMTEQFGMRLAWIDVNSEGFGRLALLTNTADMLLSGALCLFGNYLYYRFCLRRIRHMRKDAVSDVHYRHLLHTEGGTSVGNVFLALLIEGACAFALSVLLTLL